MCFGWSLLLLWSEQENLARLLNKRKSPRMKKHWKKHSTKAHKRKRKLFHNFSKGATSQQASEDKSMEGSPDTECEKRLKARLVWFIRSGWMREGGEVRIRNTIGMGRRGIISMCFGLKEKNGRRKFLFFYSWPHWFFPFPSQLGVGFFFLLVCRLNGKIRVGISYEDQHMGHSFRQASKLTTCWSDSIISETALSHTFNCDEVEKEGSNDGRGCCQEFDGTAWFSWERLVTGCLSTFSDNKSRKASWDDKRARPEGEWRMAEQKANRLDMRNGRGEK